MLPNIYKGVFILIIGVLITALSGFDFWQFNTQSAYSQQDQIEDEYNTPAYDSPVDDNNFDSTQPQNPDPQFMEQLEPGEYNQSDDVTEPDIQY